MWQTFDYAGNKYFLLLTKIGNEFTCCFSLLAMAATMAGEAPGMTCLLKMSLGFASHSPFTCRLLATSRMGFSWGRFYETVSALTYT
jgi:hypothetical protein